MAEKTNVLLATMEDHIFEEISASLSRNHNVLWVKEGVEVLKAIVKTAPVLTILDLQIGNMGGMATSLDLRLEQRAGRIPPQKILILLDREADEFLGKRSEADCWVVKPIDPLSLSQKINDLVNS
ncbi:MAG: hypothetical protein CL517_04215 [Actinobacteria bacterium]|nr:hypothetical protein [Actinomycetota bacterium]MEC7810997.1 hypothetical protein [Actinomycetota bacterium]|tara:strand:+ start:10313 stop:10687 length:375 start_codon:yes stop_codon:yes gene_type:complete